MVRILSLVQSILSFLKWKLNWECLKERQGLNSNPIFRQKFYVKIAVCRVGEVMKKLKIEKITEVKTSNNKNKNKNIDETETNKNRYYIRMRQKVGEL